MFSLFAFTKERIVSIYSTPKGAEVWSGNVLLGRTPCQISEKQINKKLVFRMHGYAPRTVWYKEKVNSFNVQLIPNQTVDILSPEIENTTRTSSNSNSQMTRKSKEQLISSNDLAEICIAQSELKMTPKEIYKKYNSAVFMIYTSDGDAMAQGSGFFVSSTGIGISNYHVFKGTYKGLEVIKLVNGKVFQIKEVLGYSEKFDYIVFRVNGNSENFNYIPITKRGYEIGDEVVAIGSPKGMENTLSNGLISQNHDDFYIQISVPIDHGSSGGALINEYGEAIGITSGGIDDSGANLNFARDIRAILSKTF